MEGSFKKETDLEVSQHNVECIVKLQTWFCLQLSNYNLVAGCLVQPEKLGGGWSNSSEPEGLSCNKTGLSNVSMVPSDKLSSSSKTLQQPSVFHFHFLNERKEFLLTNLTITNFEKMKLVKHCIKHAGGLDH